MAPLDSKVLKLAPDQGTPAFRSAPHNIEAEQSLLGAILVNNDAFYRVSDFLEPKHFFEPIHQTIYETSGSLVRIGEDMVNVAFDAPVDFAPRAKIEDAERQLYELAESGRYDGGFQRFAQALKVALDMAANAYQRDGKLSGTATGLRDLDNKMGGLQRSDLVILAGRPGMGKTALATNIAYNIAKAWEGDVRADGRIESVNGGIVGFFSLEMSAQQLATRIISEQTEIPSHRIMRGEIDPGDFDRIAETAREMEQIPLYIDKTGGLSIAQMAARARRLKRQRGLDLVVVDYIQLLQGSSRRAAESRVQEVTEITTSLK